jgi:hypothetical protein
MLMLSVKFSNKEADMPYTYYFYLGKKYLISADLLRYSEYI